MTAPHGDMSRPAEPDRLMTAARPVALVTGARRGIGAAIALELAGAGFDLALADREEDGAAEVMARVRDLGAEARFFACDLAEVERHGDVVARVAGALGPIACLVNNAGIGAPARGDLLDVTPQAFDQVLGVNLRGTFFLTQAVARHMAAVPAPASRAIVTVSSVSETMASIERGEYCVSKSGLGMLTRLFALRLAPLGIGVYSVRPGIIRTPMTAGVSSRYDQRIADGLVPAARWGEPEDVARAVAALASGRLGFATGSTLDVDGGLSIPRF